MWNIYPCVTEWQYYEGSEKSDMFGFILLAVSLFHLLAPRLAWSLHIGWKLKNAEPSDAYLAMARVGGGIGCVVSVIMLVYAFTHVPQSPTDWLSGIKDKVTQHVSFVTVGGINNHTLSAKQVNDLIPVLHHDFEYATLGGSFSINAFNGQMDITFDDGTGITLYVEPDNNNIDVADKNGTEVLFRFQDFKLANEIEQLSQ